MRTALRLALILAALSFSWEAAAAPQKKTGRVTVNCPVVDATVLIDGEEIGTLPLDPFELRFGNHTVRVVRTGLIAFEQQIVLKPGDDVVITAMPKEAKALLSIGLGLRGGEVLLDGKSLGPLPIQERPISPGQHVLAIKKEGLQTYTEKFTVGPHREFVAKPVLRNKDGSLVQAAAFHDGGAPAKGGLGLDLDLDMPPVVAKNDKSKKPSGGGLGLDLGLEDPPIASKPDSKAKGADLDLDLDLGLPSDLPASTTQIATTAQAKPAGPAVAANTKPVPTAPSATTTRPQQTATKPAGPALAANTKPAVATPLPTSTFTADPIAEEDAEEDEPSEPLYLRKWVWGGVAVAAVAGVAIPVLMGKTGGYQEVRNPTSACVDCLVVMNK